MKDAMQAVATIALAVGLAAAAPAAGTYEHGATATTNKPAIPAPVPRNAADEQMQQRGAAGRVSTEQIKEAQQQLKAEGLFRGRVDGRMSHQLKVAISRFQQQNGLKRTATLDHATLSRLTGGTGATGAGVGSSMPREPATSTAPMAPLNAPLTPPASAVPTPGAGGSTTTPGSTAPAR